jgi:MYXO-CTERM domain-containing protein
MCSKQCRFSGLTLAVSLLVTGVAPAGQIAFNFAALNSSDTAAQIGATLSTQAGSTVTVSSGVQIENTYTGDNHVVGPTVSGTVVPWTLGDSGGTVTAPTAPTVASPTYTNYLGTTSSFTMTFSVPVTSVEFDFEIYPDASPPVPQFEFSATDASNHATTVYYGGVSQGTTWTVNAIAPGANDPYLPGDPTTYTHSQTTGTGSTETSDQLLGVAVIQFSASDPAYSLTFADWPEEIAINNLVINATGVGPFTSVAPAPPSALLLGFGAIGVAGFAARSRRRRPATV